MERGYVKLWRKIEDSQSYNRSSLHRALLLTVFVKANWKESFFCGHTVQPGQVAVSVTALAEELREPRTNVQRALRDIEKDGVINLENMGNRWTMITLVNWSSYQAKEKEIGQPAVNHWLTTGQPVGTSKEDKKERIRKRSLPEESLENEDHARARGDAGAEIVAVSEPTPAPAQEPGIDFQELRAFYTEHFRPEGPLAGFGEFKQLRASTAFPGFSRLYEDLKARIDCCCWDQALRLALANICGN